MSVKEKFENHALMLGKLIGNLQSIEMGARLAIAALDENEAKRIYSQLPEAKEGDVVEWNAYTNSDDLKKTLDKFNKRAPNEYKVDVSMIVSLRDALAHGRTFGYGDMVELRLLKFSKKQNQGRVTVELAQDMSDEWFKTNLDNLNIALDRISKALGYGKLTLK